MTAPHSNCFATLTTMTSTLRLVPAALVSAASWLSGFFGRLLRYDVDFSVSSHDIESALDVGQQA